MIRLQKFVIPFFLFFSTYAFCAPSRGREAIQEIRNSIFDLKHILSNHETEIRILEEKLKNQEVMVDELHEEVLEAQTKKETLDEIENIKANLNQVIETLQQSQERQKKLETLFEKQNQQIAKIKSTIETLAQTLVDESDKVTLYQVKSGDTLEKIARRHQTTIKKIKQLNHLTSDRIYIGQKLKLPE